MTRGSTGRTVRALTAVAVVVAGLGAAAPAAEASFPGENGPIVFDWFAVLSRVEPDGSKFVPVSDPAADGSNLDPSVSPDGTRLAFERAETDGGPTFLATTVLDDDPAYGPISSTTASVGRPRWTAEGRIVDVAFDGSVSRNQIFRRNPDGTEATRLTTPHSVDDESIAPSPSGDRIYFEARREVTVEGSPQTQRSIQAYDVATGNEVPITEWAQSNSEIVPLDVSPDGRELLFRLEIGSTYSLEALDLTPGGGTAHTVKPAAQVAAAVYSPDGTKIAYIPHESGGGDPTEVRIMNADGGNDHRLNVDFGPSAPTTLDWANIRSSLITVTETGDQPDAAPGGPCDVDTEATGDQCTLRAAIETANGQSGKDTIVFAIPGAAAPVIHPGSALPALSGPVVLDGTTQPGGVALNGTAAGAADGLTLGGGGSEVRGLVVTGFAGDGIALVSDGNKLEGSSIGAGPSGVAEPNGRHGVRVEGSGNAIGGVVPGTGNTIVNNGADGIAVLSGTGNAIRGNSIALNTGLGIDLGDDGVTANDLPDADGGPNEGQNFPLLTTLAEGQAAGNVEAAPGTAFDVEVFAAVCSGGEHGQGQTLLARTTAVAESDGVAPFVVAVPPGTFEVTATATDAAGNTSEFAENYDVVGEAGARAAGPRQQQQQPVPQCEGPDADGDRLLDAWEQPGRGPDLVPPFGRKDFDLGAMGADPRHKDVFVEIDQMEPIYTDAIKAVIRAYAAAPVDNPDGRPGITLHVDAGRSSIMKPVVRGSQVTGATWGALSQSNTIARQRKTGFGWLIPTANANFQRERFAVFHYVVTADEPSDPKDKGTSGKTYPTPRRTPEVTVLWLGVLSELADFNGLPLQHGSTLMHELGHQLGLHHGGPTSAGSDAEIGNKPNHLSVMNYLFNDTGLIRGNQKGLLDYARYNAFTLATLNERGLSERQGFGGASPPGESGAYLYTTARFCRAQQTNEPLKAVLKPQPVKRTDVDWNCNGRIDREPVVGININGNIDDATGREIKTDEHRAYSEWDNLDFGNGSIGWPPVSALSAGRRAALPRGVQAGTVAPTGFEEPKRSFTRAVAQVMLGDKRPPKVKVRVRRKRALRITARDDSALFGVVVFDNKKQKLIRAKRSRQRRMTATFRLRRGRHKLRVAAVDHLGRPSKARRLTVRRRR